MKETFFSSLRLRLLLLVFLALLPMLGLILLISLIQPSPLYWAGLGVAAILGLALAWNLAGLLIFHPLRLFFEKLPPSPLTEALHESESRFRAVWEIAADAMVLSDADGVVLAANPAYYALYGDPPEAVIGHSFAVIFPEEMRGWAEEQYRVIFNSQAVGPTYESTIRRADGTERLVESRIGFVTSNGRRTAMLSVIRDVTERKLAEAALQAGEERFRHVIASISDHIYVSEFMPDGQRRNRYMSPHVEALTGYPLEKFEANWEFWSTQVIHPDDRALAATQVVQLARGLDSEIEYRLVRADGRVIWVRDSAKIEVEGQNTLVYGLVSNITSRKEAEAVIRQLNEDLEQYVADRTRELTALYEISAVASKILAVETLLDETLKRVLATMTGSREAFIHLLDEAQQRLNLVASAGTAPERTAQVAVLPLNSDLAGWVLDQEEPLLVSDTTTDPRSRGTAWALDGNTYIGAPMRVGGHALGVLSVIGAVGQKFTLDDLALLASIADQVGVTVENARLRQKAEQAAVLQERERLARELHDSVTQSLYSLNLLAAAGLTMVEGQEWDAIQHNFSRIGQMAQQALKEMRLLVYELRPLDLEQEGLVGALHRRLSTVEGRVQVTARLVADELPRLPSAVETALYRVAQEALNNALKHAAATAITVSLQLEGEQVVLEIADNGIGFDPGASDAHEGVGLASMAERIAPLGGTLEVRSTPEVGTRVIATVPAVSG